MTILMQEDRPVMDAGRDASILGTVRAPRERCSGSAGGMAADGRACEMQQAFRSTGGIIAGDEFCQLLRRRSDQPISQLARWIVHRRIVHFEWRSSTWLPLFQFDLAEMEVRAGVHEAVAELRGVFDD